MTRRLPAAERKEQVLDSAAKIVVEEGPAALTMERVAAVAGVSKPVVYAHFANADELLGAVARREFRRLDAAVAERLATAGTFEERLEAMIGPYLDAFLARRSLFRRLARAGGGGERGPDEAGAARVVGVIGFIAEEIVREFGLSKADAGMAAATLYGGFEAVSTYTRLTRSRREDLERVFFAIVPGGLRELAAGRPD